MKVRVELIYLKHYIILRIKDNGDSFVCKLVVLSKILKNISEFFFNSRK